MGKSFIKLLLTSYVFLYQLTGGKLGGTLFVVRVLLLTTTGRKTGRKRTIPLGYIEYDGGYVIIGLFAIFSNANPGWLYNLQTNPQSLIQIKNKQIDVHAEIVGLEKREQIWKQVRNNAPFYTWFPNRTNREIPLVQFHQTALPSV